MPIIAVVAAVALDVGAVGAAIAGTLTTLSAITAIGATLGAIGAVTHNKTLGIIGGVIGAVGAIGSLAFGSDALGNASDLFGSSAAGAGGAEGVADAGAAWSADTAAADTAAGGTLGGDLGAATGATTGTDITTATGALDQAALTPTGVINASLAAPEGNAAATVTGGDTGSALGQSLTGTTTQAGSVEWTGTPQANAFGLPPGALGPSASDLTINGSTDFAGSATNAAKGGFWNWTKNNPLLAYGVLQAGGSFISGLTNPMTPAQIDALKSQAAANNAAAGLQQRENENMKQPIPIASVTGQPNNGGLINRAPLLTGAPNTAAPPGLAVTGVPA